MSHLESKNDSKLYGQLVVDIDGLSLSEEDDRILKHSRVSGVVLFQRNFRSFSQLSALCQEIHAVSPELLIMVDQEGGRVQRFLGEGFPALPSLAELGRHVSKGIDCAKNAAYKAAIQMAEGLKAAGVDVCLSPMLDCEPESGTQLGDVLHERCFAQAPETIIDLAASYIRGMNDAGLLAIGKHFPGHGGVSGDTHFHAQKDFRPLDVLLRKDILPYVALKNHISGVMLSHVQFPKVDVLPCSLSAVWVGILQKHLDPDVLVLSDCLSMFSVANCYPDPVERVNIAFAAGVDLALLCNDRAAVKSVLASVPHLHSHRLQLKLARFKAKTLDL